MTELVINEIRQSKHELKLLIEAVEVRLTLKLEDIYRRLNKLERENRESEVRIEQLERSTKRNNIIIFGLKHPGQDITINFVIEELNGLVGIPFETTDINNFYPLEKYY